MAAWWGFPACRGSSTTAAPPLGVRVLGHAYPERVPAKPPVGIELNTLGGRGKYTRGLDRDKAPVCGGQDGDDLSSPPHNFRGLSIPLDTLCAG